MEEEKIRYSKSELQEFEELILNKLEKAKKELQTYVNAISKKNSQGTDDTTGSYQSLDNGSDTAERESLQQLASRQNKFIKNLENALVRIKNGTYGVCSETGKLISKERLRAVPHTTMSIEAKNSQQKS